MICKHCNTVNAPIKKTCSNCNSIIEGESFNNVTGKLGYRNSDGTFTVYEDQSLADKKFKDIFGLK